MLGGLSRGAGRCPPASSQVESAGLLDAVVAQMAASQRDEDILQAGVRVVKRASGRSQSPKLVKQRGDGAVGLGNGQGVAFAVGPRGENGIETGKCLWRQRLAVGLDGELDDVLAAEPGDQLTRRAQRDDLALIDHGDAVAEPLGLVHVMGGEQDGATPVLQVANDVPELAARLRVEPGGGLVEEEQLGVADQRDGHGKTLLLAAGELFHNALALLSSETCAVASSTLRPLR